MTLYENWIQNAYNRNGNADETFWNKYMPKEQSIYEDIIQNKKNDLKGTVKQLSEKFDIPTHWVCGFIDGVNEIITTSYNLETLEESTEVDLSFDFENLFKKMVEYKAEHLYNLPQWKTVFTDEKLKELYTNQKQSTTFVRHSSKVGRNDPCTCGSGKKYKKCCGLGA